MPKTKAARRETAAQQAQSIASMDGLLIVAVLAVGRMLGFAGFDGHDSVAYTELVADNFADEIKRVIKRNVTRHSGFARYSIPVLLSPRHIPKIGVMGEWRTETVHLLGLCALCASAPLR